MNKSVTLRDFVTSALVDINEAVKDATRKGVQISYQEYETGKHPSLKPIEFDIAIELTESQGKNSNIGGGLQLSVLNIGLDKSGEKKSDSRNVNRIKFAVDVFLGMADPEKEDD